VSPSRDRFVALLRRLGATGDPAPLADELLAAWSEPARSYHSLRHLEDCLAQLDAAPASPRTRDLVEVALWFHDARYDSRAGDNEARSAEWASAALPRLGVADDIAREAARLVLVPSRHLPGSDEAGRLLCDIDLSILGRPVEAFDAYARAVRAEYAWVPEAIFRAERARVLEELLRRDPLFHTEAFHRRFEASARANLRRAIGELGAAT
jgi:predicted metal-dependent HD superfamily phosphohydrolase